jgi:hypothetical protein
VQFPLISSDYAENWPELIKTWFSAVIGWPLDFCVHRHPVSVNCLYHAWVVVCRRVLRALCTKCTLHSNHRLNSCDITTHKTTSPLERPFSHYIHWHRPAAEMWTAMKNNLMGKKFLCFSFCLYRFCKYVSYGFPIISFCNPGVHYETPSTSVLVRKRSFGMFIQYHSVVTDVLKDRSSFVFRFKHFKEFSSTVWLWWWKCHDPLLVTSRGSQKVPVMLPIFYLLKFSVFFMGITTTLSKSVNILWSYSVSHKCFVV